MEIVLSFILNAVLSGTILWIASRITSVDLLFKTAILVAGASAIVGIVPIIGFLLSIILFFYLLTKFTNAPVWPDLILMVVVSKSVTLLLIITFFSAIKT